jgi:hypothetical protein
MPRTDELKKPPLTRAPTTFSLFNSDDAKVLDKTAYEHASTNIELGKLVFRNAENLASYKIISDALKENVTCVNKDNFQKFLDSSDLPTAGRLAVAIPEMAPTQDRSCAFM